MFIFKLGGYSYILIAMRQAVWHGSNKRDTAIFVLVSHV